MTDLLIILALILINGLFALSELAVISSSVRRLKAMAARERRGASCAVLLASDSGRFLSAVQIGITCIGIVNGAYAGEVYGVQAAAYLEQLGLPVVASGLIGFGAVVAVITFLSVVVGELVPKQLALQNAEAIACAVAPAMNRFAALAAPVVWLLNASTRAIMRLVGTSADRPSRVTDEEIHELIAEAERGGVIDSDERLMIAGVMRLADRSVPAVMTPRADVDWIDLDDTEETIREKLATTPHSRLPVGKGSPDGTTGVVQTREVLSAMLAGDHFDMTAFVREAPVIPDTIDALGAIAVLRASDVHMALIYDEYGHFEGLVTPADILEAIAGAFKTDLMGAQPLATERDDGSWLISGAMPVDEMAATLGIEAPPERNYQTVAGFMLAHMQHFAMVGEWVDAQGWRFEVVDLDGRRIDQVLATRQRATTRRVS